MQSPQVSLFANSTNTTPIATLSLWTMLEHIRAGTYQQHVHSVRQQRANGEDAYRDAKKGLKAFTPAGTFAKRANSHLLTASGLVHYDLDHVSDVAHAKALLARDPHVLFAFISPSGEGIKLALWTGGISNDQTYKHAWQSGLTYLLARYPDLAVSTDRGCKDLARLCYVSVDPSLYSNPDAVPFAVPPSVPSTPRHAPQRPFTVRSDAQRAIEAALRCIPADDRTIWRNMGMALHSTGEAWARELWDAWSQTSHKYNGKDQDYTWRGFKAEGGITLGTLFNEAKQHGYRPERWNGPYHGHAVPHLYAHANGHTADTETMQAAHGSSHVAQEQQGALPYSDYTNALAFVREHGQALRYCYPWKSWLVWTGTHWQRDDTGSVHQAAKQTIKRLARHIEDLDDDAAGKALMAHVKKSLSKASLDAMVRTAQDEPGIPVKPEAFDADPWLLNCQNGTLDLRAGTLRPHAQSDLLTKVLPIAYDPDARCPTWEQFLWRIMGGSQGHDDPDMSAGALENRHAADTQARAMMAFLQRAIGYALTGSTREQCLFILHGPTKTGKSTFLATLRALLGPYGQQADMDSFMHKDRQEVRNDLADLAGSRFVCALESQEGKRLSESLVKQVTGGVDLIKARFLFQEHFTFKPQFKIFLGTNHKPVIKDTDSAIWERIRLVPFSVQIPQPERDKALDERLLAELPGILAWAVRGCLAWQQMGELGEPSAVVEATAGYRSEMDSLGRFIEECCLVAPEVRVKAGALYERYKCWCVETGEHAMTLTAMGRALDERGFAKHSSRVISRLGLAILDQNDSSTLR